MILHKLVHGPRANIYLPYALGRMRSLNAMFGDEAHFHEAYLIDGVNIDIKQAPPSQYVRLTDAGQFDFEFTTSGKPIETETVYQLGEPIVTYKAATVACKFSTEGGTLRIAPRIVNGTRIIGSTNSRNNRQFQVDLLNEPMAHPRAVTQGGKKRFPKAVYESWAPHHPHTGVHTRNTSWGFEQPRAAAYDPDWTAGGWMNPWLTEMGRTMDRGSLLPHVLRDILYDVPYQDGMGTQDVRRAYIRGDADWPRAMGNQVVVDEGLGITREFAIYVDAFNQFFIFPVDAIEPLDPDNVYDQTVDPMYVQNPVVTFPAGVYLPSIPFKDYFAANGSANTVIDLPELDWKFNHLGTRAVTIAYAREPFNFDAAEFAVDPGINAMTSTEFNELRDQLGVTGRNAFPAFAPTHNPQRYFVAPGILQARVQITLTGPNLEDFTTAIFIDVIRDPAIHAHCTLAVGFAWYDIKDAAPATTNRVTAGDMIAFDVEQWASTLSFTGSHLPLLSIKNLTADSEPTARRCRCRSWRSTSPHSRSRCASRTWSTWREARSVPPRRCTSPSPCSTGSR